MFSFLFSITPQNNIIENKLILIAPLSWIEILWLKLLEFYTSEVNKVRAYMLWWLNIELNELPFLITATLTNLSSKAVGGVGF